MKQFLIVVALITSPALALNFPAHDTLPPKVSATKGRRNFFAVGFTAGILGPKCVSATEDEPGSAFVGVYTDPINHPGGFRNVKLLDTKIDNAGPNAIDGFLLFENNI